MNLIIRKYNFILILLLNLFNCLYATVTVYNAKNQSIELIDDFSARFGPRLPEEGFKGYLAVAKPINGCLPIQSPPNITYVNKWIALIQRTPNYNGNCSFDLKVLNAQNAGYAAVIIFNSDSDHLVRMSSSGSYNIKIPSVFIGYSDGIELQRFYTYENQSYLIITEDDYNFSVYLIPFAVIVGACFIIMLTIFAIKCAVYYHKTHKNRLSKSALKKIPVRKYQKSDKYDTCPICLDEYEEGVKIRILPCEHVYHIKCIDEWLLKNNRSCPVCKRKVLPGDDSDSDSNSDDHVHTNSTTISQNQPSEQQQQQQSNNNDVNLIDTTVNENEDDYENDSETSRLLNPTTSQRSSIPNKTTTTTTIVSLIPNSNFNNNNNNNTQLAESAGSNASGGSQYGSITQLNTAGVTTSTSPQVKIDLNSPAVFSKKQHKKSSSKKKRIVKKDTASALLNSDDSDDELLEITDDTNTNDTTLLIPDVQTDVATNRTTTTTNKSKKDFTKSV